MRLIDADELIKVLDKEPQYTLKIQKGLKQVPEAIKYHHNKIIEIIKKQPTAYDVDKVVEQLEEKELNCLKKDVITSNKRYRHMDYAFRQAIGVVKGGGE